MNSHEVFIHIHQGCFAGTGAIVRLPQCQWSMPDGYGKISQCITTTKHSKAKTVCILLGIYCSAVYCEYLGENWLNRKKPTLYFGFLWTPFYFECAILGTKHPLRFLSINSTSRKTSDSITPNQGSADIFQPAAQRWVVETDSCICLGIALCFVSEK